MRSVKRVVLILALLSGLLCVGAVITCLYSYIRDYPILAIGDIECGDQFGLCLHQRGARVWAEFGYSSNWVTQDRFHSLGIHVATARTPRSSQYDMTIPYWLVIAASAFLPVTHAIRLRRDQISRYRSSQGLCLACGYDLRESRERCPECGTPTAPSATRG